MRVLLKHVLDCDPDAAWRALRSPAVFREVSAPFVTIDSLEPDGFPTVWTPGTHPVLMKGAGLVPMGEQIIDIHLIERADGVRMVHDAGGGVSGPVDLITTWDHRMAVAPDPAGSGGTLYRDQLTIGAGVLTPAVWYAMWAFWQWRGLRMRELAPTWAYDPPADWDDPGDGPGGGDDGPPSDDDGPSGDGTWAGAAPDAPAEEPVASTRDARSREPELAGAGA